MDTGKGPAQPARSVETEQYAFACGAILARAHARTSEAAVLAGYCGDTHALDEALADWAEAYGDQTEADHALLVKAIKGGTIKAQRDSPE